MRQKQKRTAVQRRAKAVEELVPMAGIFPLKKAARRLERNLLRAKLPLTERLPSLPPTETLETPLVAAFKREERMKTNPNSQRKRLHKECRNHKTNLTQFLLCNFDRLVTRLKVSKG
jgi:hypothetical protein